MVCFQRETGKLLKDFYAIYLSKANSGHPTANCPELIKGHNARLLELCHHRIYHDNGFEKEFLASNNTRIIDSRLATSVSRSSEVYPTHSSWTWHMYCGFSRTLTFKASEDPRAAYCLPELHKTKKRLRFFFSMVLRSMRPLDGRHDREQLGTNT